MIKKLLSLLFLTTAVSSFAQEGVETDFARLERLRVEAEIDSLENVLAKRKELTSNDTDKVQHKFGGRIDARLYYDSHDVIDYRDGLLLALPAVPTYDSNGNLSNSNSQVRFSLFSSRLNYSVSNIKLGENVKASAFIEGDFMGSSDSYLQLFRLRHAYMKFTWEKDEVLVGQASSLSFVDEAQPGAILFGAKPFNIVHRGSQIRYTRTVLPKFKIMVAAEYYTAHKATGPSDAQNNAGYPDIQTRLQFGDPNTVLWGVTAGVNFLKPYAEDDNGKKNTEVSTSYNVSGFLKAKVDGYTLTAFSMYGTNLSSFGFVGGYGEAANSDGFTSTRTHVSWVDLESPSFNNFKFGVLAGYQANYGSTKKFSNISEGFFNNGDLVWSSGISPRISYSPIPKVYIGLEYTYLTAVWGKEFDSYYKPISEYDKVFNNRVEMLFRFVF
ncbi:MAG: hypothetical protein R3Y26_02660 [Rikenellaceae bacterium]